MARSKRTNQRTRKDIKRDEAKNNDCSSVKPRPDRLPKSDGIGLIAEVVKSNGSNRIDCVIVNTTYLDIDKTKSKWEMSSLTIDTTLLPKLKKITKYKTVKVNIGNLVYISYGDRLDFCYTPEETKWLNDNALVKSDRRGDVSFSVEESKEDDPVEFGDTIVDGINVDNNIVDGINLDDINHDEINFDII